MSDLSRRGFLRASAAVGGGLSIGFWLPSEAEAKSLEAAPRKTFAPNAWIRVTPDDRVQFVLDRVEMGQGVRTSHAMLVAEELFVAPQKLECLFAEADRVYDNPEIGFQVTGGSTSVRTSWEPLRRAAATAREMLLAAAARQWKVPAAECFADEGAIVHRPTERRLRYGELSQSAAQSDVPSVTLRTRDFRVIGQPLDRLDAGPKVDGSAVYGMDVQLPGMLCAAVARCPVFGGKVKSFKSEAARAALGVQAVLEIPSGVAVVASRYWQALRAVKLLEIEWDEGPGAGDDSAAMLERYRGALKGEAGKRVRSEGDIEKGFAGAAKVLEAEYFAPYVAHATMEPMNATAHVADGRCEIWSGSQGPAGPMVTARRLTGFSSERITVHQTWAGGFGRRAHPDFVEEALRLTMALKVPVKVIWTRSDDLQHDYYRPMAVNAMRGALSADGKVTAWHHRTATQSIVASIGHEWAAGLMPEALPPGLKAWVGARAEHFYQTGTALDSTAMEGGDSIPYELPNVAVDWVQQQSRIPVGFWRSVGHSHQAFVVESFIDELAQAAGKDPYEFRRALLTKKHRNRWVLELAAKQAGWGTPPPAGVFRGIAQHFSFNSYAAAVSEVSVEDTQIKVHRLVVAIDCGLVVNPQLVRAQLESAAIYGLSAALKHQITIAKGRVAQNNFYDFDLIRMHEAPIIEAHFVENQAAPSGAGEPGVPVIAPAVANAVFAATGKRLRSLPLRLV